MNEQTLQDHRPALPGGTYHLTTLLIGADRVRGACIRTLISSPFSPVKLGVFAQGNARDLVPEELAGAQPGMWWLFNVHVIDVWGRQALMWEQASIDRTLDQDELAGELARVCPGVFVTIGHALVGMLAEQRSAARPGWPSAFAQH